MSLLGSAALTKYAPVIFLMVTPKGVRIDAEKLMHTLIVAAICAGVTMYGTMRVVEAQLSHMGAKIVRLETMAEEAIRVQREIVPMRNLQVKTLQEDVKELQERMARVEKRR